MGAAQYDCVPSPDLQARLDQALALSHEVSGAPARGGWRGWIERGFVAWCATVYLRLAGISGRY